jgi:hypothetical protein
MLAAVAPFEPFAHPAPAGEDKLAADPNTTSVAKTTTTFCDITLSILKVALRTMQQLLKF